MALTKVSSIMTTQATTFAELKAYGASMSDGDSVEILGYYSAGDGGAGTFYWDATSTDTDDGGITIAPTGITTGRWKRLIVDQTAYPEWFGAKYEASPTAAQNTINRTAIQAVLNASGIKRVIFDRIFTVDGFITYKANMSIEGSGNNFFTAASGINFKFTATGNTDLFYPTDWSQTVQYSNLLLSIDAASDLGTSGWEIVLHDHRGGRFTQLKNSYFVNYAGSDNGAGNYYVVGSKYEYTIVGATTGHIFDVWIENNIWSGFDTDLWARGDADDGDLSYAVGWHIKGNFFSSVNTSNTNAAYGNLRLDWCHQSRVISNTFNGNGMAGGTGFNNIVMDDCSGIEIVANYWEGSSSGRSKIILNDTTTNVNIFDATIGNQEIDTAGATATYGNYSVFGGKYSKFGGSSWTHDNRISIANESRIQKTSAYTLTAADSGTTLWANVDGVVFTLPATVAGMTFRIQNDGADGTVEIKLSPNASDKIMGAQIAGTDDKDRISTKATAKAGDSIEVVGDGVNGWYVTKVRGIWAEQT